jgi:hypothetical protein
MGALIGSGAGFMLLILTDFGGWYNYNYYAGYQEWGYIGVSNPITLVIMIVLGLPFLYSAVISLKGAMNANSLTPKAVSLAFYLSVIELILVFVGAVIFVAAVSGSDDWWFGAGFYGPAIGGILTVVCLFAARKTYRGVILPPYQYPQVAPAGAVQFQAQQPPIYLPPPQVGYQPGSQSAYPPGYQPPAVGPPSPNQPTGQQGPQPYIQNQQHLPAGVRFCRRCGAQAVEGPFCPRCGFPIQ